MVSGEPASGSGSGRPKAAGRLSYPHLGHTHTPCSRRVPHTGQDRPRGFVTSRKKPTISRTNQVNGARHLVLGMTLPPRIDAMGVDRWSGLIERPCDPTNWTADYVNASILSARLPAPSFSTSCCSPTSTGRMRSARTGEPQHPHLRPVADRLRGGSGAPGGAGRHAAGAEPSQFPEPSGGVRALSSLASSSGARS
jgi:hypothetical protein